MQFLNPTWLPLILLPILLAVGAIFARKRNKNNWKAFVSSPRLVKRLVKKHSSVPWWISTISTVLACILTILAIARPTNGKDKIELPTNGRNLYIAIDLSKSMLVRDVSPNRLTVAKTAAIEIIDSFPSEKIGLLSFAGSAWMEAPLTSDHDALRESVLAMNEKTIPIGGSSPTSLLKTIIKNQPEEEPENSMLVIISDGEFHVPPSPTEIKKATNLGITIYTIGIGTAEGGLVPDQKWRDGLLRDKQGRTVKSSLKTKPLTQIASAGNGQYYSGQNYSFINNLQSAINKIQISEQGNKELTVYNHIFSYFLIPAMLLIVLSILAPTLWNFFTSPKGNVSTIKSTTSIILFALLLPTLKTRAAEHSSSIDHGRALIEEENYEQAIEYLSERSKKESGKNSQKLRFSQGEAEYRGELFPEAIDSFSQTLLSKDKVLQTESHYNLGNSVYQYGKANLEHVPKLEKIEEQIMLQKGIAMQYQDALDHYQGTLHLDAEHSRAQDNYDFVKEELRKLEEQIEEQIKKMQQMQSQGEGEGEGEEPNGEGKGKNGSGSLTWEELEELLEKDKEGKKDKGQNPDEDTKSEGGTEQQEEQPKNSDGDRDIEQEKRPGESEQDLAERLLKESSDAESGNLRTNRKRYYKQPDKDW